MRMTGMEDCPADAIFSSSFFSWCSSVGVFVLLCSLRVLGSEVEGEAWCAGFFSGCFSPCLCVLFLWIYTLFLWFCFILLCVPVPLLYFWFSLFVFFVSVSSKIPCFPLWFSVFSPLVPSLLPWISLLLRTKEMVIKA
ncbi:hypothetical protein NC651_003880 [Populus alba x Populus x berolinensis]|nr:hypothetical protein NC651_003880 [Populus alba x Populus x berolinensis]